MIAPKPVSPEKFARQKRRVLVLGFLLIAGGIVILLVLRRMPVPVRMMAGLGDVFAGLVLLVAVRQAPK